jgi:hypothetical protein
VSLAEMLVSMVLTLIVTTAALSLANPSHLAFQAQPEAMDMQQRVRAAADVVMRDLVMARSITPHGTDAVTIVAETGTHHYYLDRAARQLRHYDGLATDAPVADNIVGLSFEYSGEPGRIRHVRVSIRAQAGRAEFRAAGSDFVNPGTSRHSRRSLPDVAVSMRVSPRNMNLAP